MHERWSSHTGFLLASVGAAVGIGNIWRFSSVVGQNGGGAYLIPYLVSIVVLAVPLMMLELSAGRSHRSTVVTAFRRVHPRLAVGGWLINTVVFCILSYYLVITGWTLAYVVFSLTDANTTFEEFTGGPQPVVYFLVVAAVTGLVVSSGVRSGIERLTTIVMPAALAILVVLAIYAATLSGFGDGVEYLFRPRFSVLNDPYMWSAAVGQAFFSLSVGFGVLLAYGAYLDRETSIVGSAWIIALIDLGVALVAGIVIFPIVFTHGLEPSLGSELAFVTLPRGFELIAGGRFVAIAFFLLLFMAALSSAVSMLESNVAAVVESTGLGRRVVTVVLTLLVMLLGLPAALSYSGIRLEIAGTRVLDVMDDTLGTMGLPLAGLLIVLVFGWWSRGNVLQSEIRGRSANWMVRALTFNVRFVIPPALIVIGALRLASGDGFEGWHVLPGSELLTRLERDVALAIMLPILLACTLAVVAFLRSSIVGQLHFRQANTDSDRHRRV